MNVWSYEFENAVKEKNNHHLLKNAQPINSNGTNSVNGSPSSFNNTTVIQQQQQQQHPISRISQQPKFQNIHHSHSSHQSPMSNGIPSVGSPLNNVNRIMSMYHSSYPPSKSSHPPSNEGMIESPLSTYSNMTQHHPHEVKLIFYIVFIH